MKTSDCLNKLNLSSNLSRCFYFSTPNMQPIDTSQKHMFTVLVTVKISLINTVPLSGTTQYVHVFTLHHLTRVLPSNNREEPGAGRLGGQDDGGLHSLASVVSPTTPSSGEKSWYCPSFRPASSV